MLQVIDPPMLRVFTESIKHELSKKRSYEARILEIEHSSFTPLIFQPQVEWLERELMRERINAFSV